MRLQETISRRCVPDWLEAAHLAARLANVSTQAATSLATKLGEDQHLQHVGLNAFNEQLCGGGKGYLHKHDICTCLGQSRMQPIDQSGFDMTLESYAHFIYPTLEVVCL